MSATPSSPAQVASAASSAPTSSLRPASVTAAARGSVPAQHVIAACPAVRRYPSTGPGSDPVPGPAPAPAPLRPSSKPRSPAKKRSAWSRPASNSLHPADPGRDALDTSKVQASYDNGVLMLTIPVSAASAAAGRIEVQRGGGQQQLMVGRQEQGSDQESGADGSQSGQRKDSQKA